MKEIASLATTALLGSERRPPEWPVLDGEVGELLARIPREPVETAMLRTAGVLGTCHQAGWNPPVVDSFLPPAEIDPDRSHEVAPATWQTLSGILSDGPVRLMVEAFRALAGAGLGVPYRLLPKALDCGRRHAALRPFLLRVTGKRGAWLALQNEAWAFAIGGGGGAGDDVDDETWTDGSLDQRKLYLGALRLRDPAKARELVAAALASEGARERAALIECLSTSLSLDDEDLLEASLADKGKETRQTAARLLSMLPESRFARRMIERVQSCLTMEQKFLRGSVIKLDPPAAFVEEWKNDLIEEAKPKGHALGDRAWWLFQMVRAVPLDWWESHTGLKPEAHLDWARKSDWKDALLQGWAAAQGLQRRGEWAEAFLSSRMLEGTGLDPLDLLDSLPLPLRETHFLRLFESTGARSGYACSSLLDRFLGGIPLDAPPLSVDTARRLHRNLTQRVNTGEVRHDWQLRSALVELACVTPPEMGDGFGKGWDLAREEVQPFTEAVARIGIVLDQRRQLFAL